MCNTGALSASFQPLNFNHSSIFLRRMAIRQFPGNHCLTEKVETRGWGGDVREEKEILEYSMGLGLLRAGTSHTWKFEIIMGWLIHGT